MRIALLEDDPAQAAFAIEAMTTVGYICRQFLRGRELVHELRRQTYDLLMLDWMPDMSGDELLCRERQGLHAHVPVIFVTDRGYQLMEWTPPPETASMCQSGSVKATT